MSFERWENRMFDDYCGEPEYEPEERCPCGCKGNVDECTFDPEEEEAIARAEYEADCMDDYYDDICPPGYDGR